MRHYIANLLILFSLAGFCEVACAQSEGAVYGPVQKPQGPGVIVMELFTTQACAFCPKADELMKDFVTQDNLIVLSCHVDYFDVKSGSLAIPGCTARQNAYESSLRAGPKYTPQMVLNGRYEAVGYRKADIVKMLEKAAAVPALQLVIDSGSDLGRYAVQLPQMAAGRYTVWFVGFSFPQQVKIADGGNRGQEMTYYNVVSDIHSLEEWDGAAKAVDFEAPMKDKARGFAVLVQDNASQAIVMAGQYLIKM